MVKVRTRRPTLSLEPLEDRRLLDAGFLDPTFGTGGRVLTNFTGSLDNAALAVTRQTDGKLLVLGSAGSGAMNFASFGDVALARYNPDGSLDAGFGTGGRAVTDLGFSIFGELPASMQVQADGKIVVAAVTRNEFSPPDFSTLVLARFTAAGVLDTTFGTGGKVQRTTTVPGGSQAITLQTDGKVLLVGQHPVNTSGPTLARFNADGTPDTGFGTGGQVTTRFSEDNNFLQQVHLLTQTDGKVLLVGARPFANAAHVLIRFSSAGSLDTSFGTGGIAIREVGDSFSGRSLGAILQPDGKVLVADTANADFLVVRYTTAGAFDNTFGTNGRVTTDVGGMDKARGVTVQADGKIIVIGTRSTGEASAQISDFALVRYHADGALDGGFGTGGKQVTDFGSAEDEANGLHVQPDGKIVVVGRTLSNANDFAVARYNTNGTLDTSFDGDGKATTDFVGALDDQARAIAVQSDGKFLVAGAASNSRASDFALARYLASGALDTTFGTGGRVTTVFVGQSRVNALLVQSDGKIVAAGGFSSTASVGVAVARYNADGSLDSSFGTGGKVMFSFPGSPGFFGGGPGGTAFGMAQQADGKLVLVGGCGGVTLLARLNANGSLDGAFGTEGRVGDCGGFSGRTVVTTARVAVLADGKLVAAIALGGSGSGILLRRFNANGSTDESFGQAGFASTTLGTDLAGNGPGLRILADGKILVTGSAPTTNVIQFSPGIGFAIERFLANGSTDTGFGVNGRAVLDFAGRDSAADVLVQADGKLVVVGVSDSGTARSYDLVVTRLLPNGTVNTSFGVGGKVSVAVQSRSSPAAQAVLASDGSLLVTGSAPGTGTGSDFFAARFTVTDTFATANERYVGQLYHNLLGRSADPGGLAAFVGLLNQGIATRAQVAQAFAGSEEYRTVTVRNLYRTLLRREADAGGLNAFVGFLRAGGTVAQVKVIFLGSAEYFQNRTERTNDSFVRTVYQDVLGREPDAGGQQFFTQALNNGAARATVAGQIAGSRESLERITQGWYRQYLRRGADAGGLNAFVGFLQAGGREETAVAFFLSSGEFTAGL